VRSCSAGLHLNCSLTHPLLVILPRIGRFQN
jgi:hypothetical protein